VHTAQIKSENSKTFTQVISNELASHTNVFNELGKLTLLV